MLHLELRYNDYKGSRVDIVPDNECEILGLRDMLMHNFVVDNPARTFVQRMRSGDYDGWDEDDLAKEADVLNLLSDIWGDEPVMNVMMLLSKSMQMILNIKRGKSYLKQARNIVLHEEKPEDGWEKADDIPPDWFNPDNFRKN